MDWIAEICTKLGIDQKSISHVNFNQNDLADIEKNSFSMHGEKVNSLAKTIHRDFPLTVALFGMHLNDSSLNFLTLKYRDFLVVFTIKNGILVFKFSVGLDGVKIPKMLQAEIQSEEASQLFSRYMALMFSMMQCIVDKQSEMH